jgi:hypothetical protein
MPDTVVLPVTFRKTRENYCTEYIKFEVVDFETSYHAILGRPAIAKFMAVPHYTYLVLKMPSPAGVLSLQGNLKISFDYDTEAVELAATNQVFHPEWLANPVLVRKKNTNEWRMCVDYTDLNKHYPKDPFGLPRIDQVINSTAD